MPAIAPINDHLLPGKSEALEEMLYCSVAVPQLQTKYDLDRILAAAHLRNQDAGITGMLLYYRGEFVQILEGSKQSINNTFENHIGKATGHTAINMVCQNTILNRSFGEWTMGFIGSEEIESSMPFSLTALLMRMLTDEARGKSLSLGVRGFVSIYNQMRKSPYR